MKAEVQLNLSLHFAKGGPAAVIDLEKQIKYWRDGSDEDWGVACELVDLGRTRHGLFFAHLALEKTLKAHVCQTTESLPPKIHNLLRLAQLSRLPFSASQLEYLSGFDMYQLEGRYPDRLPKPLEKSDAINELKAVEKVLQWLTSQF